MSRFFIFVFLFTGYTWSFAQTNFSVKYNFENNYTGTIEGTTNVNSFDAVFDGGKLGKTGLVNDGSVSAWKAEVVKNNATNFINTFIRFDIRPINGASLLVTEIIVKQRSDETNNSNYFRIGSTLNRATPKTSDPEQSTGNIPFTDTYSSQSFQPGESVNLVSGSSLFSAFVCARGNTNTTFNWYIDEIEIKGIVLDNVTSMVLIHPEKKQQIEIMGGDMERSSDFIQNAANTREILEWCVGDIHMNYFRVRYDKMQEMVEGVKNWNFYAKQVLTMKQIRSINPNIKFLATMRSDYNGFNTDDHNNLPTWIYNYACIKEDPDNGNKCIESVGDKSFNSEKYGVFLADYVEFMYNQGVAIDYIATAKEWTGVVLVQRSHDSYISMKAELINRGIPVPPVIGPASWSLSAGVSYANEVNSKNYEAEYETFSSHNLSNTPDLWDDFILASNNAGKKAFNDESGSAAGGRTSGSEPTDLTGLLATYAEKGVMYEGGSIGEMFFEIWSRGVSSETRAVYFTNGQNGQRMRAYYVMKDFANSAVMNYYCNASPVNTSKLTPIVFRNDSMVHVWLVNESEIAYDGLSISLGGDTLYGNAIHRFWYHPIQKTALEKEINNVVSTAISLDVKANSLNYIQIKLLPDVVNSTGNLRNISNVSVYPNPVQGELILSGLQGHFDYSITDLSGIQHKNGLSENGTVDFTGLNQGVYFLCLNNQVFKVIKQ